MYDDHHIYSKLHAKKKLFCLVALSIALEAAKHGRRGLVLINTHCFTIQHFTSPAAASWEVCLHKDKANNLQQSIRKQNQICGDDDDNDNDKSMEVLESQQGQDIADGAAAAWMDWCEKY